MDCCFFQFDISSGLSSEHDNVKDPLSKLVTVEDLAPWSKMLPSGDSCLGAALQDCQAFNFWQTPN